jgi:hypothetical protein
VVYQLYLKRLYHHTRQIKAPRRVFFFRYFVYIGFTNGDTSKAGGGVQPLNAGKSLNTMI